MLSALVLDFDGVIVDSEPVHCRAMHDIVEPRFGVGFSYAEYQKRFLGFDDRDTARAYLRDLCGRPDLAADHATIAEICQAKARHYEVLTRQGIPTVPGVKDFVTAAAAANMPLAVASGSKRHEIESALTTLGLRQAFRCIVSTDDVERSKPDPTSYRLACQRLAALRPGLEPQHCLAIEDTAAGVASARGAGLWTLALTTTMPRQQLFQAHRLADDFRGLTLEQLHAWFD